MQSKNFSITEQGHNIRCRIYLQDPKNVGHLVIYGHGFAGHKETKAAEHFAEKVLSKNKTVAVLCYDLPCHGEDVKKRLRLEDCDTYLSLVLAYVRERFPEAKLYSYATSFGAYLVLRYLHLFGNPFHRIALRCAALNMYELMLQSVIDGGDREKLDKGKDVSVGFDRKININKEFIEELQACDVRTYDYMDYADAILMIHGGRDELASLEDVRKFSDDNVISLNVMDHADHRFQNPLDMGNAIRDISGFFGFA